MSKHTATPWHLSESGEEVRCADRIGQFNITVAGCYAPALPLEERKANAQFIVRAVNSHEALLEACKLAAATFATANTECGAECLDELDRAIAKAEVGGAK